MKYAKTAALVVGSVAAVGAAAPAFATEAVAVPTAPRMSLTTGVDELTATVPRIPDRAVNPLVDGAGEVAEAVREDEVVSRSSGTVSGVADSAGSLLGGLPLRG